ncbi:HAD-IA family hydrolase [Vibrio hippocampi]|uniref:6-phosphogluconate phosphatase n=1 Tax=Vibrio hippocampi TaxID=654686 RepID=A0ABN8DMV0_9VIBR|nr:HAD-IA family hydrolase [Vibrio hippocampi]CAH0529577.1 6-phosphogluconate phosphatase [Vibrio hippocampi]
MSAVKCVVFDCDGTLVDSEPLCCQALVNAFKQVGVDLDLQQVCDNFVGGKIADVLTRTQTLAGSQVSLDMLEPLYRQQTERLFTQNLQPMTGVEAVLDYLDHSSVEYCVVTNSPPSKAQQLLSIVGLDARFKGKIISAFEANSWKPEPDLLHYATTMMGFRVQDCLYIDDTAKGVTMGIDANIQTIHFNPRNQYQHHNVTCLASMPEVIEHVAMLNQ